MNEYEEEMRRKHQIQMFKAAKLNKDDPVHQYIPSKLGKADPSLTKMSQEEMKNIHEQHKREAAFADVKQRDAFEVNEEEEDEDFAGPGLGLFVRDDEDKVKQELAGMTRARKEGAIARIVKDVDEEEEVSMLPISHEVVLEGHHKAL